MLFSFSKAFRGCIQTHPKYVLFLPLHSHSQSTCCSQDTYHNFLLPGFLPCHAFHGHYSLLPIHPSIHSMILKAIPELDPWPSHRNVTVKLASWVPALRHLPSNLGQANRDNLESQFQVIVAGWAASSPALKWTLGPPSGSVVKSA